MASASPAARKPMASARRVTLFEREIRYKLSTAALDLLFDAADVLSEGERRGSGYFGSTMITIDLARVARSVREPCDADSARRIVELVLSDARVRARARTLAAADAAERAGGKLARLSVDLRSHASGSRVHIDLDVEADLAPAAAAHGRNGK